MGQGKKIKKQKPVCNYTPERKEYKKGCEEHAKTRTYKRKEWGKKGNRSPSHVSDRAISNHETKRNETKKKKV